MTAMTLRIPDEINASIKAGAAAAGLSLNAYIVRAAQRQAVLDSARRLASLGLGDDLSGEGDAL
ncbi:toxin-antitoxin system HicB family antitoxin [Streptomyces sp. NPDC057137]|uniref:toxin-antitoxin system HicB family antitoxin n=1 Tax=Streptomyces sp. NPDC057137 TaxID=3346030 RepID=UPI003641D745